VKYLFFQTVSSSGFHQRKMGFKGPKSDLGE
jgi:hypothetical protein